METSSIRLIALDLDGTLSQHRSPLPPENREALDRLRERYSLVMIGAGQAIRIFEQMGRYPIDIVGNYGLQEAAYRPDTGELELLRDLRLGVDRETVEKKVTGLRQRHGFTEFRGDNVEYHPSGMVTIPLLGTKALLPDKLAFDPDRSKRRAIYEEVVRLFPDYCVFVGGSSSFDMTPKPYDKRYALENYCRDHGIPPESAVFIGDDYGRGGNDEPVYRSSFRFLTVDDYRSFPSVIAPLLV